MIPHLSLGTTAFSRSRHLGLLIKTARVQLAGNSKLRIYGILNCTSGKRMKVENRVFFKTEAEAILAGFRPCAHCVPEKYRAWNATQKNMI
ncbi:MAG TPA: Ada metal-binding domain-containing protein [Flavitalea sp.]|nr:Ada metal-binding domain-containing protein [Flavitalea sp.]